MGHILSHLPVGQAEETPSTRSRNSLNIATPQLKKGLGVSVKKDSGEFIPRTLKDDDDDVSFVKHGGRLKINVLKWIVDE